MSSQSQEEQKQMGVAKRSKGVKKGKGLWIDTGAAAGGSKLSARAAEFYSLVEEGKKEMEIEVVFEDRYVGMKEKWECGFCGVECFCEGLPE